MRLTHLLTASYFFSIMLVSQHIASVKATIIRNEGNSGDKGGYTSKRYFNNVSIAKNERRKSKDPGPMSPDTGTGPSNSPPPKRFSKDSEQLPRAISDKDPHDKKDHQTPH
ncbi:uncharacterized protein FA14DRAFT_181188 [Meira miltonrushii]|uniref:Uncharacterized protein n=1 Tax=Meira miltonrushii TaxID=1280837 RepID=A0A316V7Q6_9BASI|nr:uncharacterized protein FA14DRAFT_181188 [Meira miltonrushii]PWN32501.1 hypothetical protein FA14DRAFT_181188 [Meira miltonrushii]